MRSEESPLDLNHLPQDFTRVGKQAFEDTSTSGQRRKKRQDEKVYECRFCSLKFCKSQSLGGHMNRHRQERETETLNKARQLVYSTDHNFVVPPHPPHLGSYATSSTICHQQQPQLPTVYPTRSVMFSGGATSTMIQPPRQPPYHHQPYFYTSTSPRMLQPGQYYMAHGHAITGSSPRSNTSSYYSESGTNYTCIGAPVSMSGLAPGGRDMLDSDDGLRNQY